MCSEARCADSCSFEVQVEVEDPVEIEIKIQIALAVSVQQIEVSLQKAWGRAGIDARRLGLPPLQLPQFCA